MPELPEVEAARRAVEEHCVGKKIRRAMVADDPKVVDGVAPNLWFRLDSPPFPSFQFGMTGAIHIKGVQVTKYKRSVVSAEDEWPSKYSKVFLELDDGLELSFTDKRRFARVRLLQNPESSPPISELGPDAFLEPMKLNEFIESLSSKKVSIKALLLDQSYIAGIGNWIADEVLYQARIHPLQMAASLTRDKCEELLKCIKEVLEKAVEVGADSSRFPSDWVFHSRDKKPGEAFVDGKKIEFISAAGRTTAYVPELQKLDHAKSGDASSTVSRKSRSTTRAARKSVRVDPDEGEELVSEGEEGGESDSGERGPTRKKAQRAIKASKKAPTEKRTKSVGPTDDVGDQERKEVKGAAKEETVVIVKGRRSRRKLQ
ncbi:unnamed protein product [Spirodela intermedia]|uniref:Formamidopyrimidine-DNA glycosylase catalytic domain-containing protein n=1 Tax=Spirodela intermedia TaxID=51605 RepID=A0A7I8JJX1_SPIIN|nr:unnamed protein product [Spirodela intermedia]CAA6670477.1 unnamed protein product [Spirodela intermedia]